MKKLVLYARWSCLLLALTTQASSKKESPETVLQNYLITNWPGANLNSKKMAQLLRDYFGNDSNPFDFEEKKGHYSFTPKDTPVFNANLRSWWKQQQKLHKNAKSADVFSTIEGKNDNQYWSYLKDLYVIQIMPPCKQNGLFYNVDQQQAVTILITLCNLMATNQQFRKAIETFEFQKELRYITQENPAPFFVLYVPGGKKDAQVVLDALAKELPFKKPLNRYIYLAPRYTITVHAKKFPGLFYTQGDVNYKNRLIKWRDTVYDKDHNYALFNPKFVGVKDVSELMLKTPKKNGPSGFWFLKSKQK